MKTTSRQLHAAAPLMAGLLFGLVGCSSVATRHATVEDLSEPIPLASLDNDVAPPTPLRMVEPQYPYLQRRAGITGNASVNCLIDELGNVRQASIVNASDSDFGSAAVDALKKWKFSPAMHRGVAVPVRANIPVNFSFTD